MAITGITLSAAPTAPVRRPDVAEAVETTIRLFMRLGCGLNEPAVRESFIADYTRLIELGNGRLYVELPAAITHDQLLKLASELAVECGYESPFIWAPYWVPGAEKNSITEQELDGTAADFTARIALFSDDSDYDPLLWFTGLPFDDNYTEPGDLTQVKAFQEKQRSFVSQHSGASLRTADHRDFLVWYIMDLLRGAKQSGLVLAQSFMCVPVLGRRFVDGDLIVGSVYSLDGRAWFGGSDGIADSYFGVGLVAGFEA